MKIRISKKALSNLPAEVSASILRMQQRHPSLKSFTLMHKAAGWKYYPGEEELEVIYKGEARQVEMAGEHNLGAYGISYARGAETPALPAGTTIVVVGYYAGYHMTVYNVGDPALTAV